MMTMQDETESSSDMFVKRYILALLYFATYGPNWFDQLNFLGNSSICYWWDATVLFKGVTCNDKKSATQLSLGKFVQLYCLQ
jgi:hypothetical protein